MVIIMGVKWLKAVLTVALIGAFALATNHCRLEVLKGLEFLVCCSHDAGAESDGHAAPHQDDDCQTDGCASLENGLYKSEDGRIPQIVPLIIAVELVQADDGLCAQVRAPEHFPTFATPELPASWQFLWRVASPPRAPSLDS